MSTIKISDFIEGRLIEDERILAKALPIQQNTLDILEHLLKYPVELADGGFIANPGLTHASTVIESGLAKALSLTGPAVAVLLWIGGKGDVALRSPRGYIGHWDDEIIQELLPMFPKEQLETAIWTLSTFGLIKNREGLLRVPTSVIIKKA